MNTENKLEELELRQREIADEIKALRGAEIRESRVGNIYRYLDCDWLLTPGDMNMEITGKLGAYVGASHASIADAGTYLGKFSDVFITKREVAKVIQGASINSEFGGVTGQVITALADIGITPKLAKEDA